MDNIVKGKIKSALSAAEKEDALNNSDSKTKRSKIYEERVRSLVDAGLCLNPSADYLPNPQTIAKLMYIVKLIAQGKSKINCVDYITNEYGVSESTAIKYYDAAVTFLIPEDGSVQKEKSIAILQTRYEQLYEKAYEREQYKTARDILDSLAKLQGLTGGNTVKIAENAEGDRMIQITFD